MESSWAVSNPERWCCESAALNMPANLENLAVATALEKVSFHSNPKESQWQRMFKLPQIVLISHTSKVMFENFQARLQQWTENFKMFKLYLEKAEEPEITLPTYVGSSKKQESSRKTSALLTMPKLWLCGSQQTVENSSRDGNTRPSDLPPEKSVCRSRSNSYNRTWKNRLVPNWERSTSRLYIVTLLI